MNVFWIEAQPWDSSVASATTLRACSVDLSPIVHFGGQEWIPVLDGGPIFSTTVYNGDFSGRASSSRGEISLIVGAGEIDLWARYEWASRSVKVWKGTIDTAHPGLPVFPTTRTLLFDGVASTFDPDQATIFLETRPPVGTVAKDTYDATGGPEGTAELKGVVKPFAAGTHRNQAGVLIDAGKLLWQLHGYGAISSITQLRERGVPLDQPIYYHATFDGLYLAEVPATEIHCHLGSGTFRVGFQPVGSITADFEGAEGAGAGKIGDIVLELLAQSGWDMAAVDTASVAAISLDNPHPVAYADFAGEDIAEALTRLLGAAGCYWDVDELGQFYVGVLKTHTVADVAIGDEGYGTYDILEIDHLAARAPFWRIRIGYAFNPEVINFPDFGLPDLGYVGDPDATRNDPGQLLQDAVWNTRYWTLGPGAQPFNYSEAPNGVALAIAWQEGVDNLTSYGGTRGRYVSVFPGRTVFFRLVADPGLPVAYEVVEGGDQVVEGPDNIVETPPAGATWTLYHAVQFYTAAGIAVGPMQQVALFDPLDGRQEQTIPITPPEGAYLARAFYGHLAGTGKEGIWSVWSPWQAEYQPAADITAQSNPSVVVPAPISVRMNYLGQVVTPMPIKFRVYRLKGGVDRSADAGWTVYFPPGTTGSVNDAPGSPTRGEVTITAVGGAGGTIRILSNLENVTLTATVPISVGQDPPPTITGGSAKTYALTLTGNEFNTAAFARIGPEIPFVAAGTSAALAMSATFNLKNAAQSIAEIGIEGKFQISADAGASWTDCGAAEPSTNNARVGYEEVEDPYFNDDYYYDGGYRPNRAVASVPSVQAGYISVSQNTSYAMALTPGLSYVARFVIRRTYGVGTDVTAVMLGNGSVVG